jgi:hypothetical protein
MGKWDEMYRNLQEEGLDSERDVSRDTSRSKAIGQIIVRCQ